MAKYLQLSFYADLKAESDLKRLAIVFEVRSIAFSTIDLKESQVNGARLNDAIVHEKVEDYMQGFRNGDTFPRPVVHKTATGYVILSGNQRCEAIRRLIIAGELPKSVEIEAYVIDTKDKLLLEIVARSANVGHGEGLSKEERILHAAYCVQTLGLSVSDAAKNFLVSEAAIRENIKAEAMRAKLQKSGVDAHRIPNNSLSTLHQLEYDEPAQVKIGALAAQHGVTCERMKQVVATVKKQTTQQGRFQKIKELEKELAVAAHETNGHAREMERSKVPVRPRRDKFLNLLSRLSNFLESENGGEHFRTLDELQVTTKSDVDRAMELAKKVKYRLGAICK